VVAAFQPPTDAAALAQSRSAVAAAIPQRRGSILFVEEQHDVLAQQRERPWRFALQGGQWHGGVPELAEDLLLAGQHSIPRSMKWQEPHIRSRRFRAISGCLLTMVCAIAHRDSERFYSELSC
jgi:hypothetical protein